MDCGGTFTMLHAPHTLRNLLPRPRSEQTSSTRAGVDSSFHKGLQQMCTSSRCHSANTQGGAGGGTWSAIARARSAACVLAMASLFHAAARSKHAGMPCTACPDGTPGSLPSSLQVPRNSLSRQHDTPLRSSRFGDARKRATNNFSRCETLMLGPVMRAFARGVGHAHRKSC